MNKKSRSSFYKTSILLPLACGLCLSLPVQASAQSQSIPRPLVQKLDKAATEYGPAALLETLADILKSSPELAASPQSASALATAAAAPVDHFRGYNLPVYEEIVTAIVSYAPKDKKSEIKKAVRIAVDQQVAVDESISKYLNPEQKYPASTPPAMGKGVIAESFRVIPQIQVAEFYDNNIFATRNNKEADYITVVSPHVYVQSLWSRHKLKAEAHYDATHYAQNNDEDSHDFWASMEGRYDFLDKLTRLFGGAMLVRTHEDRESPDDVFGINPTVYSEGRLYAGLERNILNWTARVGDTAERMIFKDDTSSTGSLINNTDRNRNHYTYGASFAYNGFGGLVPYFHVTGDSRRYNVEADDNGFDRDSIGYSIIFGSDFKSADKTLFGSAEVGYMTQNYDDPNFSTVNAAAFNGHLNWQIRPTTLLSAFVNRAIDETTLSGASSSVYTGLGGTVEQSLSEDMLLSLRVLYSNSDFQDIARSDDNYEGSVGLRYALTDNFYVAGDYRYQKRDSNVRTSEYTRNQVFLRAGYKY